jgi:hypothetical protein
MFYRVFIRSSGKAAIGRDVKIILKWVKPIEITDFSLKPLFAPLCHHKVLNLVTGNLADMIANSIV